MWNYRLCIRKVKGLFFAARCKAKPWALSSARLEYDPLLLDPAAEQEVSRRDWTSAPSLAGRRKKQVRADGHLWSAEAPARDWRYDRLTAAQQHKWDVLLTEPPQFSVCGKWEGLQTDSFTKYQDVKIMVCSTLTLSVSCLSHGNSLADVMCTFPWLKRLLRDPENWECWWRKAS